MDGMDVFIYFVVCISSLIKFIKQDDKYIYINLNVKSVKRKRCKSVVLCAFTKSRLEFLPRLYRVFCTSIPFSCT